jgi:hypothetical protein
MTTPNMCAADLRAGGPTSLGSSLDRAMRTGDHPHRLSSLRVGNGRWPLNKAVLTMAEARSPWWSHVVLATTIAGGFAAVPFWTRGLSIEAATVAALIIFLSIVAAYIFVMRASRQAGAEKRGKANV